MIIIWYQVKKYLGEPSSLSHFSPIWGNQFFPPGRADPGFRKWAEKGLKIIGDLMGSDGGILMSFEELITRYDIPNKHYPPRTGKKCVLKHKHKLPILVSKYSNING